MLASTHHAQYSLTLRCIGLAPQSVYIEDGKLLIPKFKKGIEINIHRKIEGKLLFATISKSTTGKYYVSITCEVEYIPVEKQIQMLVLIQE